MVFQNQYFPYNSFIFPSRGPTGSTGPTAIAALTWSNEFIIHVSTYILYSIYPCQSWHDTWLGTARPAWHVAVLARHGTGWHVAGLARRGTARHGTWQAWHGTARHGMARGSLGTARHGTAWHVAGLARRGTARRGTARGPGARHVDL